MSGTKEEGQMSSTSMPGDLLRINVLVALIKLTSFALIVMPSEPAAPLPNAVPS